MRWRSRALAEWRLAARIAAVGAWILVWVATPGAEMRWIDVERSTVTVYVSASGAPRAAAAGHVIEASLAEGSVDDSDTPHLALVINVGQLRLVDSGRSADERQKVQAQMLGPEGLDAERFSRITYPDRGHGPAEPRDARPFR